LYWPMILLNSLELLDSFLYISEFSFSFEHLSSISAKKSFDLF
jgi:hypothetical protein